jgi:anti-anti-sigma regulatory factor
MQSRVIPTQPQVQQPLQRTNQDKINSLFSDEKSAFQKMTASGIGEDEAL